MNSKLIDTFKVFLNKNKSFKNHFIFGDFNIDISKISKDSENLLNNFSEFGFTPLIQSITRLNERSDRTSLSSCIDHIYSNSDLNTEAYIYSCIQPDHYPIYCEIELNIIPLTLINTNK